MATRCPLEPGGQRDAQELRSNAQGKRPGNPNGNERSALASASSGNSAGSLANNSNKTAELQGWSHRGRRPSSTSSDESEENEAYARLLRRSGSQDFGERTMKWCRGLWSRMTRRREPMPTRKLVISEPCRLQTRDEDILTCPRPAGDAENVKLGKRWEALGSHPVDPGELKGNHDTPWKRRDPTMLPRNHSRASSSSPSTTAKPATAPRLTLTTPEGNDGKPKVTYRKSKGHGTAEPNAVAQTERLSPNLPPKGSWRQAYLEMRAEFQRLQSAHKRLLAQNSRGRDDGDKEMSDRNKALLREQLARRTAEARESAAKLHRREAQITELEELAHRREEQLVQVAEGIDPLLDVLDRMPEHLALSRPPPSELRPHEILLWAIGEVNGDHEKQLRAMHEACIKEVEFYRRSCNMQAKRVLKTERELGILKRELEGWRKGEGGKGEGRQRDRRSTPAAIWGTGGSMGRRRSAAAWTMLEVGGGHTDERIQLIKLSSCPTWIYRARPRDGER